MHDENPSPSETLRLATAAIRRDWPDCECHRFERAVADWLDAFDGVDARFIRDDHPALKVARAYLEGEA